MCHLGKEAKLSSNISLGRTAKGQLLAVHTIVCWPKRDAMSSLWMTPPWKTPSGSNSFGLQPSGVSVHGLFIAL